MAKKSSTSPTRSQRNTRSASAGGVRRRAVTRHVKTQGSRKARGVAGPSDGLVVYIHGIGRHKPAPELKSEWDLALFGSGRGDRTRMAYWSDLVHPTTAVGARAKVDDDVDDTDRESFVDAALAKAGVRATDEASAFAARLLERLAPGDVTGGARKKVLPLPGFLRRPLSRIFLEAFVSDTAAYFFNAEIRQAVRARLTAQLPADQRTPVTLVAHSQGSVVAAEVLASRGATVNIVKLVTIGSPLGLQEVQDLLDVPPGKKPFAIPAGIERWHNVADPLDPVAFDKGLEGEFVDASQRPDDSPEVVIVDEVIVNSHSRRLVGFNPHSAVGYLSHQAVRRSVFEATQHDPLARFVVARDVAEALAVDERHSVLIEALEPGYPALDEDADACATREKKERARTTTASTRELPITLEQRVTRTADEIVALVKDAAKASATDSAQAVNDARVDRLRRFVSARLTPDEIRRVALDHEHLNVYAVWKSTVKRKLITRSRAVLQADAALESYGASGSGIVWAVLDTGARSDHLHFARHHTLAAIWDCTRPGPPKRIEADLDRDGHGSHVAGIIAGEHPDWPGFRGVAPRARLVVYKVLNDRGEGEDAWIIKALDHVAEQNENSASMAIHGLNLSLGGPYDSSVYGCGFTPICMELRRLWRTGVLVVVASGNEGQLDIQTRDGELEINAPMSIGDPANLEDSIAVGSVNADRPHLYGVSAFSSRGPTSDGRLKPDVVAPGERIRSVDARYSARGGGSRDPYRVESGTSMAAPHVSGLLAAFLSARREFRGRPDEVKRILLDACTDIGRDRYHQGRGIPNLMKMLLSV